MERNVGLFPAFPQDFPCALQPRFRTDGPPQHRCSRMLLEVKQGKFCLSSQGALQLARLSRSELSFRPRTTNANWGVFFEIATKDSPVWITGLHAGGHSFASFDDLTRLDIGVYTKQGTCVGSETDKAPWKRIAEV